MKLVLCLSCTDIFSMRRDKKRFCECKRSWGMYTDSINASIGGMALPLGFANSTLVSAIHNRTDIGDGVLFTAFVIPRECPTIIRVEGLELEPHYVVASPSP